MYGLGGTIGIVLVYIFKPPFMSLDTLDTQADLFMFLTTWWIASLIGRLFLSFHKN